MDALGPSDVNPRIRHRSIVKALATAYFTIIKRLLLAVNVFGALPARYQAAYA
jgi:hypothetical protein